MVLRKLCRVIVAVTACLMVLQPQRADAGPAGNQAAQLEALGATAAIALYNSHLLVAISADALLKGSVTDSQAMLMITEQRNMMNILAPYVENLLNSGTLTTADAGALERIRTCCQNIVILADSLDAYVGDKSPENAYIVEERRKESYASIAQFLGLDQAPPVDRAPSGAKQ